MHGVSFRRRLVLAAGGALLLVAAAVAGVIAWAGPGGPGAPGAPGGTAPGVALVPGAGNPASAHAAEVTLRAELTAQNLHYTNVTCIRNGRVYQGRPIVRCNVDFGDPHIEAYCTVVEAGRLITNFQNPAIPCGEDQVGSKPILLP